MRVRRRDDERKANGLAQWWLVGRLGSLWLVAAQGLRVRPNGGGVELLQWPLVVVRGGAVADTKNGGRGYWRWVTVQWFWDDFELWFGQDWSVVMSHGDPVVCGGVQCCERWLWRVASFSSGRVAVEGCMILGVGWDGYSCRRRAPDGYPLIFEDNLTSIDNKPTNEVFIVLNPIIANTEIVVVEADMENERTTHATTVVVAAASATAATGHDKKRLLESLAIAIESGADARNRKKLDRDGTRAFGFLPSLQSRIAARRALAHQLRMECGIKDELSKAIFCLDSPSKDIPRKEENRKASKIPSSEGKRRTRTADYRSCPLANSNSDPKADGSGLDLRPGTASSLSPEVPHLSISIFFSGHRGFKTDWRVPKKRETASEAFANFPSQARAAELKHQRLLFRHWLLLSGIHSSPLSGKNSLEALGAMESGEVALVSWSAVSARVKMLDGARFALEMEMPNQVAKNHRFRRGNEFRKDPIPSDIESVGGISAAISAVGVGGLNASRKAHL
ncbi:unnamed protein product [Sphenostylis stenocarpa]|uniref:Uncharacterized protein n=1 Tax=Sphenostylis stenocarpa TaxID=92480 RepID=A0AA87B927_9FABA|nr:unnamed protein product [Sphenostylis stenocarpa]